MLARPTIDHLTDVLKFRQEGRFSDALAVLEKLPTQVLGQAKTQVLRAELLERVGRAKEAESITRKLLPLKALSYVERSVCEFVLARIDIDSGNIKQAVERLNRSIGLADLGFDLERKCVAQLTLFALLSDRQGTEVTTELLLDLRTTAARTGSPQILASVHAYFAQVEALRGSVHSARRHVALANRLLTDHPNLWLSSLVENICLALAIMTSEFELAEVHARNGFQLVEKTGAANEYVVNQANSGFLWHSLGRLEDAVECYERALALMTPGSEVYRGTLDSLARVRLAQGRLDDCETLLAKVNSRRLHQEDRPTYVNRHQLLTRAKLAMARRDPSAAARILDEALRAAEFAGDELLVALSLLGQVDVAIMNGDMSGIVGRLERVTPLLRGQGELFARYERAIGEVEFSNGNQMAAFDHLRRSSRLHEGLHHVQGLSELHQSSYWPGASSSTFKPSSSIPAALHSVVTMLSNSQHPEFLAREFVTLLGAAGVSRAVAISRCSRGLTTVLAQYTEPGQGTGNKKTIRIGQINGKTIEVLIEFANDIESLATVNSGASLISQTVELEHVLASRRSLSVSLDRVVGGAARDRVSEYLPLRELSASARSHQHHWAARNRLLRMGADFLLPPDGRREHAQSDQMGGNRYFDRLSGLFHFDDVYPSPKRSIRADTARGDGPGANGERYMSDGAAGLLCHRNTPLSTVARRPRHQSVARLRQPDDRPDVGVPGRRIGAAGRTRPRTLRNRVRNLHGRGRAVIQSNA